MKVYDTDINIPYLFRDVLEYYQIRIANSEKSDCLSIEMNIDPQIQQKYIRTDGHRLKQLMNNLLDNAFKFTKSGKIEFGCSILSNDHLLFFVKDTGIGISKENHWKIFERFHQVEDPLISKQFGGTGIGLSIAKGIVVLLNGNIWVESELGKGSRFYFTIPYVLSANQPPVIIPENEDEILDWKIKKIMIVEDDPGSMEFLCEVLSNTKINIVKAYNAEQGLNQYRLHTDIDMVLTDIQLPDFDGIKLTQMLKTIRGNVPVIAQTAYSSPDILQNCLDAGCNDYILKPTSKDSLVGIIQKHIFHSSKSLVP